METDSHTGSEADQTNKQWKTEQRAEVAASQTCMDLNNERGGHKKTVSPKQWSDNSIVTTQVLVSLHATSTSWTCGTTDHALGTYPPPSNP